MNMREQHIKHLSRETFDVVIVGGGINGAVSAAALSARGYKVGLIDARDFAGFTSQQSSNLIWGGIKYLETYEFKLVANLCKARNTLITHYPSMVRELRFLATIPKSFRQHLRMVWAGTWLYWLMGRGFTRKPKYLSAKDIKREEPAVDTSSCRGGVEYSDAYLMDNDARFVFNFVRTAISNGCAVSNYLNAKGLEQMEDGGWSLSVEDQISGDVFPIHARAVINAAGAFVDSFNHLNAIQTRYRHAFSKGVHLIVPQITRSNRVLAFIADDGRLFFAIPMGDRSCIGTTDTQVSSPDTRVSEHDRDFILDNINARLSLDSPLTRADIIAERCGVRPLAIESDGDSQVDFLQLSRRHIIEVTPGAPYMSIFGGKLTDCLNVGEEVCQQLEALGIEAGSRVSDTPWYGEPDVDKYAEYCRRAKTLSLELIKLTDGGETLLTRLWRRYGLDAFDMLEQIENDRLQATPLIEGCNLFRCELKHFANKEMVTSLGDVLHRRSKIALMVSREVLKSSPGTMELCRALFGDAAQGQFDTYFTTNL